LKNLAATGPDQQQTVVSVESSDNVITPIEHDQMLNSVMSLYTLCFTVFLVMGFV